MKPTLRFTPAAFFSLSLFWFAACATPVVDDGGGSGGNAGAGTGGGLIGTGGGLIGTGGSDSLGGDTGSGGTSSGGTSSGGVSSGGSASGGAGTGGQVFEGDCAGKPTYAAWKATTGAANDQVVFACAALQASCAGRTIGQNNLFQCTETHVPNCASQSPQDGSSWTFVTVCE